MAKLIAFINASTKFKAYYAGAGLFALSFYQVTTDQFGPAYTSFLAGLAAIGWRANQPAAPTNTP